MKKRNLFYLIATLLTLLSCTVGFSQTCDFTYVAQELPLLAVESQDVTENLAEEDLGVLRRSLPNGKMFFATPRDPFFSVGLAWAKLPENYASLSREQATERLHQIAELANWQREFQDHPLEYYLLTDDPISAIFAVDYQPDHTDGGEYYRDIRIDIIATPECMVRLKLSTVIDQWTDEELNHFRESLTDLRSIVLARHGAVQFDPVGNRLTQAAVSNHMILICVYLLVAAFYYWIYSWNHVITPGKASRRYAALVVVMAGLLIGFTFLVNESLGVHIAESRNLAYAGLVHWFFVLFLHAWSYKVQSPVAVLASISYILAGLTLSLVFFLFGRMAPPTGMWSGVVGTLMVLYVLGKSSLKKKRVLAVEEEGLVINEQ